MASNNRHVVDDSASDDEDADLIFPYQNDRHIGQNISILLTWASLGLVYTILGPNLLAIACNIQTKLDNVGLLFVSRGLCMFAGGVLGRYLLRHQKTFTVLLLSLIMLIITIFVFPVTKTIGAATGVTSVMGFAFGATLEGYSLMYEKGQINTGNTKQALAFAVGAAISPLISMPFIANIILVKDAHHKGSKNVSTSHWNRNMNSDEIWEVFPGMACSSTNFAKAIWISAVPCCFLLIALCFKMINKSHDLEIDQSNAPGYKRISDWKVNCLRLVSVGVTFFYHGGFIIAAFVLFTYRILEHSYIGTTKTALLVSLLWVSFSFGVFTLQLALIKIIRTERRLGTAVFKASICFIASVFLLKITNIDGETLTLFIYMFFIANLNSCITDALKVQGVLSPETSKISQLFAMSMAETLFPYFTLKLMYHEGVHVMNFAILFQSLMLFLCCTFIAICPSTIHKGMVSMHYENLTETVEDGQGRKIRKDIKRLLGGYTDQGSAFSASEEEIVFDKHKRNKTR